MSDKYRSKRFKAEVDPDNYAAIAAVLRHEQESSRLCGPGYQEIAAPTSGGKRPRAKKCCYNQHTETLVIVMTDPQAGEKPKLTWIQYDDVTSEMWDQLQNSGSTNDFVTTVLYGWPWIETFYGALPRSREEAFKDAAGAFENYEDRYKFGYTQ